MSSGAHKLLRGCSPKSDTSGHAQIDPKLETVLDRRCIITGSIGSVVVDGDAPRRNNRDSESGDVFSSLVPHQTYQVCV